MSGSIFGTHFKISTWGESHGKAVGVVIDGCPAGLSLCEEDIQKQLDRRKPGQSKFATHRSEEDRVEILSGIFEGKTTGTPISMFVHNKDQRSKDYGNIAYSYRPGHADYTFDEKYGIRDYRGGGRSSGRETIARVAAGAVASKILLELGIQVKAYTKAIGPVSIDEKDYDFSCIEDNPLNMPNKEKADEAAKYVSECMAHYDSCGGIVECIAEHLPTGLGEPVFHKLDACLAKAIMSIGAVKGVEIGDGFEAAKSNGSKNNDPFRIHPDGYVIKTSNHAGGVLGGISDGSTLILRAAVKPTSSIFSTQQTITKDHEEIDISIKGRHDPVIVPRAVVVVESMTAITLVDLLFANMYAKMDSLKKLYER